MEKNIAFELQRKTIKKVFQERSDFIVIGLTGSSGSNGIHNIVDILCSSFDELQLPEHYSKDDFGDSLEYSNIYNYAKQNWVKFDLIKARDVIITYILENINTVNRFLDESGIDLFNDYDFIIGLTRNLEKYKRFVKYEEPQFEEKQHNEIIEIIDEFLIGSSPKEKFLETLMKQNNSLVDYINILRNKSGSVNNSRTDLSLYVYTKYILPVIGYKIKEMLGNKYVELFQYYGNEIRFWGTLDKTQWKNRLDDITEKDKIDYFYSIAKRINTFIKIRRSPQSNRKSVPLRIVVDSLKNPYESSFLKDRYSAYYTVAILENTKEQYDDERFAVENYASLLENPGLIKHSFKTFISIMVESVEQRSVSLNSDQIQYIKSLKDAECFIEYMYKRIDRFDGNYRIDICPELRKLDYDDNIAYKRAGIVEEEFNFYQQILKEPIRAFCMISGIFPFYLQDIQDATQNADIFISSSDQTELKYQAVKYISLIMHPGLVPPTEVEKCMQIAFSAKVNSGCISRQVGAVVTDKDYNILSIGWNDAHCNKISCIFRNIEDLKTSNNVEAYSDMEKRRTGLFNKYILEYDFSDSRKTTQILDGLPSAYCFKSIYNGLMHGNNPEYSRAIHAEARAFWSCGNKELVKDGCLFTTSSSCENCTMLANEYGVKKIYYIEKYSGISKEHVNAYGNLQDRAEFILFEGAIGTAYMKLYTPVLPMKDEMDLRGIGRLRKL